MNHLLKIFQIPELKIKILYTLGMLAVYRIGIFVTTPGIDRNAMKYYLDAKKTHGANFLNLFNFFSGGALENASIFALGIMPYITSSIIMSLIIVAIPYLGKLQKEGENGRQKINQYARLGAILIAFIQSIIIANYFKYQNYSNIVLHNWGSAWNGIGFILITIITLTTGTVFLMWLGEKITERGIGNGISLIIFAGIVARLPHAIYETFNCVKNNIYKPTEILLLMFIILTAIFGVVFIERGQRRIPVQYAKRVTANKQYGGQTTHLPLKINTAGVIPPIFA